MSTLELVQARLLRSQAENDELLAEAMLDSMTDDDGAPAGWSYDDDDLPTGGRYPRERFRVLEARGLLIRSRTALAQADLLDELPLPPVDLDADPAVVDEDDCTVTVAWAFDTESLPVTGWSVVLDGPGAQNYSADVDDAVFEYVFTVPRDGATYLVQVRGEGASGSSEAASTSVTVATATVPVDPDDLEPGPVRSLVVTAPVASDTTVTLTVTWVVPNTGGTYTGVDVSISGDATSPHADGASPYTQTLTRGSTPTTVTVSVEAVGPAGNSAPVIASVVVPASAVTSVAPPTGVGVVSAGTSDTRQDLTVSWTASVTAGATYEINFNPGPIFTDTASPYVFDAPRDGAVYDVLVRAVKAGLTPSDWVTVSAHQSQFPPTPDPDLDPRTLLGETVAAAGASYTRVHWYLARSPGTAFANGPVGVRTTGDCTITDSEIDGFEQGIGHYGHSGSLIVKGTWIHNWGAIDNADGTPRPRNHASYTQGLVEYDGCVFGPGLVDDIVNGGNMFGVHNHGSSAATFRGITARRCIFLNYRNLFAGEKRIPFITLIDCDAVSRIELGSWKDISDVNGPISVTGHRGRNVPGQPTIEVKGANDSCSIAGRIEGTVAAVYDAATPTTTSLTTGSLAGLARVHEWAPGRGMAACWDGAAVPAGWDIVRTLATVRGLTAHEVVAS